MHFIRSLVLYIANYFLHFMYLNVIIYYYIIMGVVFDLAKQKKWMIPEFDKSQAQHISERFGVSELVGRILASRGFTDDDETEAFLNKNNSEFHNPFLMHDMEKAVKIISDAIENKTKIAVCGDYDVDGITATYIVYDYLKSLDANVIYHIPDRIIEGYGISTDSIDTLKSIDVGLIITVDVGITAISEVEYAKKLGMEIVVTDHHNLKDELPDASAVVNPKIESDYPFDSLAGVGVAFKLAYALSGCDEKIFKKYCGIAAIGTIADMVPLRGENRYIASVGIECLKNTDNIGVKELLKVSGVDVSNVNSSDISFLLSPRLNAAGRIANAALSVELLLDNSPKSAFEKAIELDNCNKLRQKEEQQIFKEALEIIQENGYEKDNFIVVAKENWLHGVIGIVSSRLTEMFYKPSAVISINPDGTGKASGRSIKGINIFEALSKQSDHLLKFGGHELAAGFTVREGMVDSFRDSINEYLNEFMTEDIITPTINIDAEISLSDINLDVVNELSILEPYGVANKAPLFCLRNVVLKSIRCTQNGKHAFLTVENGKFSKEIPAFSMAEDVKNFKPGDVLSIVGSLSLNIFRNCAQAQFVARDIHKEEIKDSITRDELARIFSKIRCELKNGNLCLDKKTLMPCDKTIKIKFSHSKFKTALKIFEELEILSVSDKADMLCLSRGKNFQIKTNLVNSKTYRKHSKKCV